MKHYLFKFWLILVCLIVGDGMSWAEDADYTLTPSAGSNNTYTGNCDIGVNGITWNVTGNASMVPWRIGGKSITNVDREVYSKTAYTSAVSKVDLTVGAASSITINHLKLIYSTNSDFSNSSEISKTFTPNSTISFEANFPKNAYYKFVFNVTVSGSSNKFIEFSKVEFYNESNSGGDPDPMTYTITVANDISNGIVTASPTSAVAGAPITLTATADTGYEFDSWNVTDASYNAISVTDNKFIMPADDVNVSATFKAESPHADFIFNTDAGLSVLNIDKPVSGAGTSLGSTNYTLGNIIMTATDGGTNTRVWNSDGTTSLRVYDNGGSLTFSGATIKKIVFTGTVPMTANVGTFSDKTWTGEATSVTFTATNSVTISTIIVTYTSVGKTIPPLFFDNSTYNATMGEYFVAPTLTNPKEVTVSYSSSKEGVARVNATTGEVELIAPGTTTITAAYDGSECDTYNSNSASYQLIVAASVQKYTISYAATENGTIVVKNGETPLAEGAEVAEGTILTIECIPANEDYRFKNWQYKAGDASWATRTADFSYTMPSANVQFKANFELIPVYTIAFSVNGKIIQNENLKENATVTAHADPEAINGKVFTGWIETATIEGETPAYVTPITAATKTVTYFAVFANIKRSDEWIEITSAPVAGTYAICSESYFMKASISNNRFENGNSSPVIVNGKLMVAPAADCIWEISKPDSYYRIQYGTNYAAGTNSMNQGAFNATVSDALVKWTITYVTDHFEIVNIGRSQSSHSNNKFLRNNTTYGWATYASGTGSAPRLFKLNAATYSDYCTTVPSTATITIASACTDGETCYSTYSNASAFVVPEGLTISTVGVDSEGKLVVNSYEEGDIVAANTGVMISGAAGDHVVTLTDATATAVPGVNNLHPSSEAMTGDYLFYRLTMHNGTQIGFWWGAEDGAAFSLAANKAYLAVPKGAAVKGMNLWLGNEELTTGIKNVVPNSEASRYDLTGRRIKCSAKGIQFVNGRKVIR